MWCIRTMEYHSALKRKEILKYATTWMNLEDIMPSEISQLEEDGYYKIPLYEGFRAVRIIKTESRMRVAGGW